MISEKLNEAIRLVQELIEEEAPWEVVVKAGVQVSEKLTPVISEWVPRIVGARDLQCRRAKGAVFAANMHSVYYKLPRRGEDVV